jgi:integrase
MTKLTKRAVESVTPELGREVFLWDEEIHGFGLRVMPSGRRTYFVQYRVGSRTRRLALGAHGVLAPEQARDLARDRLAEVRQGRDPSATRHASIHGLTVGDFAERYLVQHAEPKKRSSSLRTDRYLLATHLLPRIGRIPLETLTRQDVTTFHHAMRETPIAANRAVALLSKMMNLAERWGLRPDGSNPCRHVEKYPETKRRRFLSDDELAQVGEVLDAAEREGTETPAAIAAIRLLLLTGARLGEILGLRWDQVDREARCIRLRQSKTGAKEIPLGAAALAVLDSIKRTASPWVIAGREPGCPLVNLHKPWRRIRKGAGIAGVTLHDLRRTAASAGASVGLTLEAVGQILGHTQVATTKRYAFLFGEAKLEAAEAMSARVAAGLRGEGERKVLPLRRKG